MARFLLIALNGPTSGEGDEAAYNTWYDQVHAADLMSVTSAQSVRRFKVEAQNRIDKPYVNVTEILLLRGRISSGSDLKLAALVPTQTFRFGKPDRRSV